MPIDHRAELSRIKRFDQLIAYLRDEMDWPIGRDSFEDVADLFYDFTADELGIDPKTAAKIQEIKRLRPLSTNQPWGIFFVKFEPKRLPVVALRRILSQVALKKRASANSAERTAWAAGDLLFVSNYGDDNERKISFAHFSPADGKQDLPILRVLGWDDRDTALHLDGVATELTTKLSWPQDESDAAGWRERWRSAFTLRPDEVIKTSKALAVELAKLARKIRDRIRTVLTIETDNGPVSRLMKAFQEALVHDLDASGFADMYAQTIAYGLLSARITNPHANTADSFAAQLPVTNPFLKELMETFLHVGGRQGRAGRGPGIDFDELGVSEVVDLLDRANMGAVVSDFGDKNPQEDPVIHFYELFLKEYDAAQRIRRGVFYTPRPVVSYIVRSVHELLQTEFGLEDGLADTATWGDMARRHEGLTIPDGVGLSDRFVTILDVATGTGTFIVEVIEVIHRTLVGKWGRAGHSEREMLGLWNEYVPTHLLPRLHGFELLMAPYAIAHLRIGLKLRETGYRFETTERVRVYLTNALEPASDRGQQSFAGFFPALAHEAQAVNEIKRKRRFTVVVGNPPYSNFGQLNKNPFILGLLEDYKRGLGEKKLNLDDDFIKFLRFSQHLHDKTGLGVVGMITNNVFLDGLTHRRMRESLIESFSTCYLLNLHGDIRKREAALAGEADRNVFDIQQGVSIILLLKRGHATNRSHFYADLFGTRNAKYNALGEATVSQMRWRPLAPTAPHFFFVPKEFSANNEYMRALSAKDVFLTFGKGVKTERDRVSVHFTRDGIQRAVGDFVHDDEATLRRKYLLQEDSRDWKVASARADVIANIGPGRFRKILYRPFDVRNTWYSGQTRGFIGTPGFPVMRQMLPGNLAIVLTRQLTGLPFNHCLVSRFLVEIKCVSHDRCCDVVPWYLFDEKPLSGGTSGRPNLKPSFLRTLSTVLQLPQQGLDGLPAGVTLHGIFHYAYALFHSPSYRRRYAEFLKIDFPRLLLPGGFALFCALGRLGGELVALHLLESPKLNHFITTYSGPESPEVDRVGWSEDTVWLDAAATKKGQPGTRGTIGFRGVPEAVWNFHIGGYQVCEKWLKDRKGRTLSADDIAHYQKIVVALAETIRLMKEIDEVIEAHGGWPGAFATAQTPAAPEPIQAQLFAEEETPGTTVMPFRRVNPRPEERNVTCVPLVPLKAAAGAFSDPQHIDDADFEWVEPHTTHRLRPGMFIAQVEGHSMEPTIPDGAYCLFATPVTGTRHGKTVLVQLRDQVDRETGHRYTVKRYESEKAAEGDSWRHTRITLKPINPAFPPIVLTASEADQLQVIAELVEVLGRRP